MSTSTILEVFGEPLTVADMAELSGLTTSAVHARINRGMPALAVILAPKTPTQGVDMVGLCFGRLTVLREAGRTAAGKKVYECQCACGSLPVNVVGADIRSGRTTSCGCAKAEAILAARERGAENLTGKTFADGWTTVLGPGEFVLVRKNANRVARSRLWRCQCRCGKLFEAKAATLRKGQVTSCGCRKRALTSERMKATAVRYDFFGERLTLNEIAEVTGVDGPTIRYRVTTLGMTIECAALGGPLRRYTERPKGRTRITREAA